MSELNREFLLERDSRMFQMKKGGLSTSEIAKRFGVTTRAVSVAITRQLERLNQEALLSYPEVLRMELERLDTLQAAIWPLTQSRRATMADGTEVLLEPDIKATQQVLGIMDRRAKLLGIDRINIDISTPAAAETVRSSLQGREVDKVDPYDPETEARQLLELMERTGVLSNPLPLPTGNQNDDQIEDAELEPRSSHRPGNPKP